MKTITLSDLEVQELHRALICYLVDCSDLQTVVSTVPIEDLVPIPHLKDAFEVTKSILQKIKEV